MLEKRTILLIGVPNAISNALKEHDALVNNFNLVIFDKESDPLKYKPSLIICFDSVKNDFLGAPRIDIVVNKTYRLGELLLNIIKIMKEPNLYIENILAGRYTLSPRRKLLVYDGDIEIKITDRELDALVYIFCNIGREVTREELLKNVWNYKNNLDTHTLETHIYRIRQKVEKVTGDKDFLITGDFGYLLNAG